MAYTLLSISKDYLFIINQTTPDFIYKTLFSAYTSRNKYSGFFKIKIKYKYISLVVENFAGSIQLTCL